MAASSWHQQAVGWLSEWSSSLELLNVGAGCSIDLRSLQSLDRIPARLKSKFQFRTIFGASISNRQRRRQCQQQCRIQPFREEARQSLQQLTIIYETLGQNNVEAIKCRKLNTTRAITTTTTTA
ncbi:unnamed protein product [Ceratitis capitata]|uniref:(Mediterranean fruit fly) hypothetical protein n=1 Tax=Ceratitis capitata TaxID=7213 RepID=A0A811V9I4_CERCA|nr:unnamed protein product [Ceratitis capitata]